MAAKGSRLADSCRYLPQAGSPKPRLLQFSEKELIDRTERILHCKGDGRSCPLIREYRKVGNFTSPLLGKFTATLTVAQQTIEVLLGEALLPAPYAVLGLASPAHDLDRAVAIGAQQDDLGTPNMLLWTVAVPDHRCQGAAIRRRNHEGYGFGDATRKIASRFRMKPFTQSGEAVEGRLGRVPVIW